MSMKKHAQRFLRVYSPCHCRYSSRESFNK